MEILLLAGFFAALIFFWKIQNKVVRAESQVVKCYTDLMHSRQSGQDLLNDYIVSIATYSYDERQVVERHYKALENIIQSGFGHSALAASTGPAMNGVPTRVVELYQTRMQEVSRLHERFNQSLREYTSAVADYHTLRHEFPASLIPSGLIGSYEQVPLALGVIPSFIDVEATRDLINRQRDHLGGGN